MFTRLLDALREYAADPPRGGPPAPADRGRGGNETALIAAAHTANALRDPILPHPSAMLERWRQEVARGAITLRDRYHAEGPHAREHTERLLLKLTLDQDMVLRQPPPAAQEALAVAGDPECQMSRLVQSVERDPVLTRGLMRHASSAMFAAAGAPTSIDDAARRLGAKGVQIAVLASMAEGLLARGAGPYSPRAHAVWASMVRVGPLARTLARAVGVPAHEAFLLGLLHDVGALVLLDLLGAVQAELPHGATLPEPVVDDALRDLHEPLGGLTLLRWGIDPRAAWAVAHHHRRMLPANPDRRSELIFLADHLDAALVTHEPPNVEQWFAEGQLTVSSAHVTAAVDRIIAIAPLVH